jgi:hypothetical protein
VSDKETVIHQAIMTSSFRDLESAERAYNAIVARGYKRDEIHLLMSDETRESLSPRDAEKSGMGIKALEGAGIGGAVGGVVGGAAGATFVGIAAAAVALALPGLGLVIAGPMAGAVVGLAAGAATGGLVGMLVGAGISEERARVYEIELNEGGIVIGVTPRHAEDARHFKTEWQGTSVRP